MTPLTIDAYRRRITDTTQTLQTLRDTPAGVDWGDNVETLGALLAAAEDLISVARDLRSQVDTAVLPLLPKQPVPIEGVGLLTYRSGSKRSKWDHARASALVTRDVLVDKTTGEIIEDPARAVERAREALLAAAGISYWKVGVLRDMGVDVEAVCETSYGRPSVQLQRVASGEQEKAA